jgi:hypothetical protein
VAFARKSGSLCLVRETYFAVVFVALVASGIGAYGIHRYRTDDVDAALRALPGNTVVEEIAGALGSAVDLGVRLADHLSGGSPDSDAEREARVQHEAQRAEVRLDDMERLSASYAVYRQETYSPEVDATIRGICTADSPDQGDVFRCLTLTREGLLALRRERDESRSIYEHFYGWSRVLWGFGIAIALLWLFRSFRQMRAKQAALAAPDAPRAEPGGSP